MKSECQRYISILTKTYNLSFHFSMTFLGIGIKMFAQPSSLITQKKKRVWCDHSKYPEMLT